MKTFLTAVAAFFILTNFCFAQWHWQNPVPVGKPITDLQITDSLTGYACGYGGLFLKTTDAGNNWNEIETPEDDLIIQLFFLNNDTGWFLTYNDQAVFKTTDGGETWDSLSSFSPVYASSIYFINEQNGFAVGYYSYFFRTSDGGITWTADNSIIGSSAIYFLDELRGYIASTNILYRTVNGGNFWTPIDLLQYQYTPSSIYAYDQYNIYVAGVGEDFWGDPFYLYLNTSDGGQSWDGNTFENQVTDVYFTTPDEGYVCNDKILKTSNRGITWDTTDFYGLEFQFYQGKSWSSYYNTISFSEDGWESSNPQIRSIFSGFIFSCYAKDTNTVFSCGSNKTILGTNDGGKNWYKYYSSEMNKYLNGITIKGNDIWSVGQGGIIIYSRDGGATWNEKTVDANWLNDITFLSNGTGFIAGTSGSGVIFTSTDDGETWTRSEIFTEFESIEKIKFSRDNLGWAIGYPGVVFRSTDHGNNWGKAIDSIYAPASIAVSGDTAWISYLNKILRTTDAGESWQSFKVFDYLQISFNQTCVDFVNSKIGYECTYDGRVFKTTDGGETWTKEEFPAGMVNYSLDFVNEEIGWVTGWPGTILKRDPYFVNADVRTNPYPNDFVLYQNYPNPFNPATIIRYSIPANGAKVTLKIYDVLGSEIAVLVNTEQPAGEYHVQLNGRMFASGVYFYQLKATPLGRQSEDFIQTKKMILLK